MCIFSRCITSFHVPARVERMRIVKFFVNICYTQLTTDADTYSIHVKMFFFQFKATNITGDKAQKTILH